MIQGGLYYGTPTVHDYCAYQYMKGGEPRPDLRCSNEIEFYVKIPDGRGDDWRNAWASCNEHLPELIWQMQEAYGGGGFYSGAYLLRAYIVEEESDARDGRAEPEAEVPGA